MSEQDKIKELAQYVEGLADGTHNEKLHKASQWLNKLLHNICGAGFIGCRGGRNCGSDHK